MWTCPFSPFQYCGAGNGGEDHPPRGPKLKRPGWALLFNTQQRQASWSNGPAFGSRGNAKAALGPSPATWYLRRKEVGHQLNPALAFSLSSSMLAEQRKPGNPGSGPARPPPLQAAAGGHANVSRPGAALQVVTPTSPSILPSAPMQRYRTLCTPLMATLRRATALISTRPGSREEKSCSWDRRAHSTWVWSVHEPARHPPHSPSSSSVWGVGGVNAEVPNPGVSQKGYVGAKVG